MKPHLHPSLRNIYGAYNHLFVYFALNDAQEFYDFMHLSLDHYITLLTFVRQKLVKHSRRPPLSPDVRLAVVLQYVFKILMFILSVNYAIMHQLDV